MEWQTINTAPKDGTHIILGGYFKGVWHSESECRWATLEYGKGWWNGARYESGDSRYERREVRGMQYWMPQVTAPKYIPVSDEVVEAECKRSHEYKQIGEPEWNCIAWDKINEGSKNLRREEVRKEFDGPRYVAGKYYAPFVDVAIGMSI